MVRDYLQIAREFMLEADDEELPVIKQPTFPSNNREQSAEEGLPVLNKRNYEISPVDQEVLAPGQKDAQYADWHEAVSKTDQVLRLPQEGGGEFAHKASLSGERPELEQVLERQAWLAKVDWRVGLRCGLDGHRCTECRGIPCDGTTYYAERIN